MSIIEPGMEPLKVRAVKRTQVEKLSLTFEGMGWAHVFVEEFGALSNGYGGGELAIHSDWGTWAYMWTGIGQGKTLKQFLCRADNDYIARKLMARADCEEWDPAETEKAIEAEIEEAFTDDPGRKQVLLDELHEECDWDSGMTLWFERMPHELYKFLGGAPWEHVVHKPTTTYVVLTEGLLPAIKAHL